MQNKQSFITAEMPIINKMLSLIWKIGLNQEAISEGSQLKIPKNCGLLGSVKDLRMTG